MSDSALSPRSRSTYICKACNKQMRFRGEPRVDCPLCHTKNSVVPMDNMTAPAIEKMQVGETQTENTPAGMTSLDAVRVTVAEKMTGVQAAHLDGFMAGFQDGYSKGYSDAMNAVAAAEPIQSHEEVAEL